MSSLPAGIRAQQRRGSRWRDRGERGQRQYVEVNGQVDDYDAEYGQG